jgi:radical SAM superfamily enzyme YgiQ (UPF0313 family)
MKILLISANRERSPYPVFPIGLAYLAGPLHDAGHELSVLDLCFEPHPEKTLIDRISQLSPELALISLRNIDNVTWPASRSYLENVRSILAICRPHVKTVVGGSGFSLMPVEILKFLDADIGVVGEGEEIMPLLAAGLEKGEDVSGLPGVLIKGNNSFLPPLPAQRIGAPYRELFDVVRYQRDGGMANVQTKRGCPFNCIYCTYPLLEGRSMRLRPVPEVIAELKSLSDQGVSYVYFVDDIFNYPMAYAGELCRAMTSEKLAMNWSAFINPAHISPELLDDMIEAGCDAVEFGTETGSPTMLKNLGKSFNIEQVRIASLMCEQRGVDFAHYILFGGPGETEQTVLETFALMDELKSTAIICMIGIRIFPGTSIYQTALDEGIITKETNLLEPVFYISEKVRDTLGELVKTEAMQRRNWVVPGLEVNISDAMLDALRMFPVKGPLWKLMKRLGRSRVKPIYATLAN